MGHGSLDWIRGFFISIVLGATALGQASTSSDALPNSAQSPTTTIEATEQYCNSLLPGDRHADPLHQACIFALTLKNRLPNFQCRMRLLEYAPSTEPVTINYAPRKLVLVQTITARARFVDGKDYYDELRAEGARVGDKPALVEGMWSTGEFGVRLSAAFAPQLAPQLKFVRETKIDGNTAFEYQFAVSKENNTLWVWISGGKTVHPGYEGRIWLAKSDARVLRVEMKSTDGVPDTYPLRTESTRTDFAYVDFKDGTRFLLPSFAQLDAITNVNVSYRQAITFTHCERFRGTGRIVTEPSP